MQLYEYTPYGFFHINIVIQHLHVLYVQNVAEGEMQTVNDQPDQDVEVALAKVLGNGSIKRKYMRPFCHSYPCLYCRVIC